LTDPEGFQYWLNTIGADNAITPEEEEIWKKAAAPELEKKTIGQYTGAVPAKDVKSYFEENKDNPGLVAAYATRNNIPLEQMALATGKSVDELSKFYDTFYTPIDYSKVEDYSKDLATGKTLFGTGGQFGYTKGVANLDANTVDKLLAEQKEKASSQVMGGGVLNPSVVSGDLKNADNKIGWSLDSYSGKIAQGLDALGVTYDQPGAMGSPGTKGNIWDFAEKAGVNKDDFYKEVPTQYGGKQQVFDDAAFKAAVNDKYKDFYAVTGLVEGGEHSAFTPDLVSQARSKGADHAQVLYTKVGDKLVPISDPQFFKAQREGTGFAGFVADVAPYALMMFPGVGQAIGSAVGLSGTTAAVVGNAAHGGLDPN